MIIEEIPLETNLNLQVYDDNNNQKLIHQYENLTIEEILSDEEPGAIVPESQDKQKSVSNHEIVEPIDLSNSSVNLEPVKNDNASALSLDSHVEEKENRNQLNNGNYIILF